MALVVGSTVDSTYSESLGGTAAVEALEFVFGLEGGSAVHISSAEGATHHSAFTRKSFIQGVAPEGGRYAEQVLKVGWPFTIARAFVHETPEGRHTHGVFGSELGRSLPAESIYPVQPVWPGVLFWGLVGVAGAAILGRSSSGKPLKTPK